MFFIGGIHGVGKSVFCEVLSRTMQIPHFSSSELISRQKNEKFNTDKKVSDYNNNQNFLLDGIKNQNLNGANFLLDGHFCLINNENEIIRIPENTFIDLAPSKILVLINEPEVIWERLLERDGIKYDLEFIEVFQSQELSYANEISVKLNIPISIIDSKDLMESINKAESFLNNINIVS